MRFLRMVLGGILFIAALTACQSASQAAPTPQDLTLEGITPTAIPETIQIQTLPPTSPLLTEEIETTQIVTPDAKAQKLVKLVQEHLAQRLGIPADQIVLAEIKAVNWRDSGLGCAKPGVDYIPRETPGYNIRLEAGGQSYTYHTDQDQRFVLCNR